jgi:peroxiredoxin Q/BCP
MKTLILTAVLGVAVVAGAQESAQTSKQEAKVTAATGGVLQAGAEAPAFSLDSSTGSKVSLAEHAGKVVVLYFYPKADTPGCTKEACGFRDAAADYDKAKVVVLGVSPDPVEDVTKFAKKYQLNFALLADPERTTCKAYGVLQQKGDRVGVARTTFVIGRDGKIAKVFESVKVDAHDKQVLEWIQTNLRE